MAGAGAFLQGLGTGFSASTNLQERQKDRDLRNRELAHAERQAVTEAVTGQRSFSYDAASHQRSIEQDSQRRGTRQAPPRGAISGQQSAPVAIQRRGGGGEPEGTTGQGQRARRGAMPEPEPLLFDLIDDTEGAGRYDTLFGHSQRGGRFDGVDVSRMTLGELREFSKPSGEYGQWVKQELARSGHRARVATPMGRHQIVGTTLRSTARELNLPDDTVFNRQTQNRMANHLARQRLSSATTMQQKMAALRAEWEGFQKVDDARLRAAIIDFET